MGNTSLIRTALLLALLTAFGLAATGRAPAADPPARRAPPVGPAGVDGGGQVAGGPVIKVVGSEASSQFLPLGVGKSVVIDLPRDIKDVLVGDPAFANAVIRSSRRAYIIGVKPGQTSVYFFDAEGQQIGGFDIAVTRDLNGLRAALKQSLPGRDIHVEGLGDGVVLTGNVSNPIEAQQAFDIASRLLDDGKKVVNNIAVHGREQVMIKVTVAEVQRGIVKQLGIDLSGPSGLGQAIVSSATTALGVANFPPFPVTGQPLFDSRIQGTYKGISATLRAMERAGVVRTLAEPNLTAISGENATFVAGGEVPIPAGYTCSAPTAVVTTLAACQYSIQWKKFGISLNFTPVVLSEGRISLKVMTEVSDLSSNNAITVAQPNSAATATIPSIRTRRADTTVELPSGGSLALAGMIQDSTRHNINGFPGLMQLPILGPLFKSNDYINQRTELMVLVTPYIVRAVASKDLSRPDDGFADPSDPAQVLLGRFNRIYGVGGKVEAPDAYHGKYGFILD
jgi:pilus assembly protein CpaC